MFLILILHLTELGLGIFRFSNEMAEWNVYGESQVYVCLSVFLSQSFMFDPNLSTRLL